MLIEDRIAMLDTKVADARSAAGSLGLPYLGQRLGLTQPSSAAAAGIPKIRSHDRHRGRSIGVTKVIGERTVPTSVAGGPLA